MRTQTLRLPSEHLEEASVPQSSLGEAETFAVAAM